MGVHPGRVGKEVVGGLGVVFTTPLWARQEKAGAGVRWGMRACGGGGKRGCHVTTSFPVRCPAPEGVVSGIITWVSLRGGVGGTPRLCFPPRWPLWRWEPALTVPLPLSE